MRMRAIDGDALLDKMAVMPIDIGFEDVERVEEIIKDMPTIEPERKQEKCIWCDSPFRIEYYWIDREGCTASFADEDRHMVATGIAKYCPNCGRQLNAEMTEGEG